MNILIGIALITAAICGMSVAVWLNRKAKTLNEMVRHEDQALRLANDLPADQDDPFGWKNADFIEIVTRKGEEDFADIIAGMFLDEKKDNNER